MLDTCTKNFANFTHNAISASGVSKFCLLALISKGQDDRFQGCDKGIGLLGLSYFAYRFYRVRATRAKGRGTDLTYISIDGDDIGRRVTAKYLTNDAEGLSSVVALVREKVTQIENLLTSSGFRVIFCAADGVVGHKPNVDEASVTSIYASIQAIGGRDITFSAGAGESLREAYIALLAAKSQGKARLCSFSELA
jgi:hypothetical protein